VLCRSAHMNQLHACGRNEINHCLTGPARKNPDDLFNLPTRALWWSFYPRYFKATLQSPCTQHLLDLFADRSKGALCHPSRVASIRSARSAFHRLLVARPLAHLGPHRPRTPTH